MTGPASGGGSDGHQQPSSPQPRLVWRRISPHGGGGGGGGGSSADQVQQQPSEAEMPVQSNQVQADEGLAEEETGEEGEEEGEHCPHCGERPTKWRQHPTTGQRLCNACGEYARSNRGQLPGSDVLQRRAQRVRTLGTKEEIAQRRCSQCGSSHPGAGHWSRNPVTQQGWVCNVCYCRLYSQLRKQAARSGSGQSGSGSAAEGPPSPAQQRRRRQQQQQQQQQQPKQQAAPRVGDGVEVMWATGGGRLRPFAGRVAEVEQGRHLVAYDDGEAAWHDLSAERWRLVSAAGSGQPTGKASEGGPAAGSRPVGRGRAKGRRAATPLPAAADASGPAAAAKKRARSLQIPAVPPQNAKRHKAQRPQRVSAAAVAAHSLQPLPPAPVEELQQTPLLPQPTPAAQPPELPPSQQQLPVSATAQPAPPLPPPPAPDRPPDLYSLLRGASRVAAAAASGLTAELVASFMPLLGGLGPREEGYLSELLGGQEYGAAAAFLTTYMRAWRRAASRDDA